MAKWKVEFHGESEIEADDEESAIEQACEKIQEQPMDHLFFDAEEVVDEEEDDGDLEV